MHSLVTPVTEQRTFTIGEVTSLVRDNLIGWGVACIVFCVLPSILIFFPIPKFAELFRGFGADLPIITRILMDWRFLVWTPSVLAVILLWFALTSSPEDIIARHRRIIGAFAALCCFSIIIHGIAVFALYAPILLLGAVV